QRYPAELARQHPWRRAFATAEEGSRRPPRTIWQFPGPSVPPLSTQRPLPGARRHTAPDFAGRPWLSPPASYQDRRRQYWPSMLLAMISRLAPVRQTLTKELSQGRFALSFPQLEQELHSPGNKQIRKPMHGGPCGHDAEHGFLVLLRINPVHPRNKIHQPREGLRASCGQ